MASVPIRHRGLAKKIKDVLCSDKWQTASLISMQIVFPPEVIARDKQRRIEGRRGGGASSLTCRSLLELHKTGKVKRRKNEQGYFEYKLNDSES